MFCKSLNGKCQLMRLFTITLVVFASGCSVEQHRSAGISQFVEVRDGRESVWGVNIQLNHLSFVPQILDKHIRIVTGKRGKDIKHLMQWSVSPDRKRLCIKFKPHCGDFGTGNAVTIFLDRAAINGYKGGNDRFEWSLVTEIQ